ncbi:hypothetical protein AB5N19_12704 [Seiridium cardinale]|uniref:Uncharacterized protein n=1 Tax=Seiridium cardinale TaxID=138064 RepID=A0ABR2Y0L5_9PEZI
MLSRDYSENLGNLQSTSMSPSTCEPAGGSTLDTHQYPAPSGVELTTAAFQSHMPIPLLTTGNGHGNRDPTGDSQRNPRVAQNIPRQITHGPSSRPLRSEPGDLPGALALINCIPPSGYNHAVVQNQPSDTETVRNTISANLCEYGWPHVGAVRDRIFTDLGALFRLVLTSQAPIMHPLQFPGASLLGSLASGVPVVEYLANIWDNYSPEMNSATLLSDFIQGLQVITLEMILFLEDPLRHEIKLFCLDCGSDTTTKYGNVVNMSKLAEVMRENASRLGGITPELKLDIQIRFLFEILSRCFYVGCFLHGGVDASSTSLAPRLTLDCWLYETEILETRGNFNPVSDDLVRMYGMGKKELRWLQNNPAEKERIEQILTLERYHVLKSRLGVNATEDIREQLCFCYFEIRNRREFFSSQLGQDTSQPPSSTRFKFTRNPSRMLQPDHHQRILARKREFKIAKIMVDRVWKELVNRTDLRKSVPRHRCDAVFHVTDMPPKPSNWSILPLHEKKRLLGFPTEDHPTHPDFYRLADTWLEQSLSSENYEAMVGTARLHDTTPLSPPGTNQPVAQTVIKGTGSASAEQIASIYSRRTEPPYVPFKYAPDPRSLRLPPSFLQGPSSQARSTPALSVKALDSHAAATEGLGEQAGPSNSR